jgi:hypothetical protein
MIMSKVDLRDTRRKESFSTLSLAAVRERRSVGDEDCRTFTSFVAEATYHVAVSDFARIIRSKEGGVRRLGRAAD